MRFLFAQNRAMHPLSKIASKQSPSVEPPLAPGKIESHAAHRPAARRWLSPAILGGLVGAQLFAATEHALARERLSLDVGWKFTKDDSTNAADALSYAKIKDWVNATGTEFTKNAAPIAKPAGNPGGGDV